MSETKHKVRIDNIRRAKKVWGLKLDGSNPDKIAKALSVTEHTINKILKYTNSSYYLISTEEESYYDSKVTIKIKIENRKKKLLKITNYVASKRQFAIRVFEATAVLISFLIMI